MYRGPRHSREVAYAMRLEQWRRAKESTPDVPSIRPRQPSLPAPKPGSIALALYYGWRQTKGER